MCGFVGYYEFKRSSAVDDFAVIARMSDKIEQRGPDSYGYWADHNEPLVFGHRRLAIVDLSAAGHQPMQSSSTRYMINYNGELYNTPEVRSELEALGIQFKGHSDTEVLLEACAFWGVETALSKVNGMFAFALWDKQDKRLFLARDRLGIKPLYWGFNNDVLFFGSQLTAFSGHPDWQPQLDREALVPYFRFNYIPAPQTIYKEMFKLKPGCVVTIDSQRQVREQSYWKLTTHVNSHEQPVDITQDDIESLLSDSVKRRMMADVPLGAFLSGGIDSSLIVALMQSQSSKRIKTFTIGFHEPEFNEATHAKAVASHLGTDHNELYLSMNQAADLVPSIQQWYGEPFADSSQIPTYLVSQLAKQQVTVSLSGDGGDELFAGYNRYRLAQKMARPMTVIPRFLRRGGAGLMTAIPESAWDRIGRLSAKLPSQLGNKIYKFAHVFKGDLDDLYQSLVSLWQQPEQLVLGQNGHYQWPDVSSIENLVSRMQAIDGLTYLPDDILTKVDRASMACSLEARVPLLDHRVVEMAYSMPLARKIQDGKTKWPLREILYKHVPQKIMERPKMGFGVPIGAWLRQGLRDWAEDLLNPIAMDQAGILDTQQVQRCWQQHLNGTANWQYALWGVLMFQDWQRHNGIGL
ncbi:MAG: asparagine synthase (glutamine-hydrolyzing) [Coxiella sp. (in: Bacteria)]|nr:MAG: asparagine synthase (glutamine-hydrolyzing) [Coxiella sp. (in: g-proteobacteria)]